ncbi:MAG: nucleotidyltransferase domain-containing protein [Chloroflexi bacterium]|nr:nucleotidyltransferase domain-containing protein [Chloroflexota bacterium]
MTDIIARRFHPLKIYLFGSLATGSATRDSDVDLLVVMPDGTDPHDEAIRIGAALARMRVPKDVVVTTPAEIRRRGHVVNSALRSALREGRLLYGRP